MKKKLFVINQFFNEIVIHSILSIVRALGFQIMAIIINNIIVTIDFDTVSLIRETNNLIYAIQLNFFQCFFILKSIIFQNHFEYILSIFILVHNVIVIYTLIYLVNSNITRKLTYASAFNGLIYFFEFSFILWRIIKNKVDRNFETFKKIGADPKINEAYNIRRILRSLGFIDLFLCFIVVGRFFLPPIVSQSRIDFSVLGIFTITLLQHLFIGLRPDLEDVILRKIAFFLTGFKLIFMVGELVAISFNNYLTENSGKAIKMAIYSDILTISVFLTYYLVKDFKLFGSGLNQLLTFNTVEINLSNKN
jgi:hypothetical protein